LDKRPAREVHARGSLLAENEGKGGLGALGEGRYIRQGKKVEKKKKTQGDPHLKKKEVGICN